MEGRDPGIGRRGDTDRQRPAQEDAVRGWAEKCRDSVRTGKRKCYEGFHFLVEAQGDEQGRRPPFSSLSVL